MFEIYHNLFVGSLEDYEGTVVPENGFVLHAAKEPYHRNFVGYKGNCPKDHPEYLKAVRGKHIALNLVDAQYAKYFDYDLIFTAVRDILTLLYTSDAKVYIHCNQGESRAPGIAFLVLLGLHVLEPEFDVAMRQFKMIYPKFNPGKGMFDFLKESFPKFIEASKTMKQLKEEGVIPDEKEEEYVETTPEEEGFIRIADDAHLKV